MVGSWSTYTWNSRDDGGIASRPCGSERGGESGLLEGDNVSHKVELQDNSTVIIGRDRL